MSTGEWLKTCMRVPEFMVEAHDGINALSNLLGVLSSPAAAADREEVFLLDMWREQEELRLGAPTHATHPEEISEEFEPPLHTACRRGHLSVVKESLSRLFHA